MPKSLSKVAHLATPLPSPHSTISTRRNNSNLITPIPELERVYKRRLNKATSRRTLGILASEALLNIHFLFETQAPEMADDLFFPLDFTQIAGYPHDLLDKAIDKLPTFQGNNAVSAKSHVRAFSTLLSRWARLLKIW